MLLTLLLAVSVQGGCADATTQVDMNRCAQVALQRADAALFAKLGLTPMEGAEPMRVAAE